MITSPANPLVKEIVRLRSRRHRDTQRRFLIEGRRPLAMALAAGVEIIQEVVCTDLGGQPLATGSLSTQMASEPFRKASALQNPDGVLAIAAQLDIRLERLDLAGGTLVLVVESVEKPGNLGAMLRTADAVGVDAVLVADQATDVHNPNVVRASQGALFAVPIAVASTTEIVTWLRRVGVTLVATTVTAPKSLWEADLRGSVAILVGAESTGLSTALLGAATEAVTVPMAGRGDSLNASVTAALVLYEAVRQRSQV